jgi:hypothetical protein
MIITDPTTLISGGDTGTAFAAPLSLDTGAKTFTITPGSGVLPDAADGVTGQALYSAFKLLWKNNSTYIKFPFPMEAITPEQFEFINGWTPANDVTRKALRTCGWVERNTSGAIIKMYAGIVSLGSLGATDQPYYQQVSTTNAPVNFTFLGPVNEAVQILDDPNGDGSYVDGFDRRSYMKLFAREYQKTYSSAQLSDIGVTSMTYIVYRFPLANADDSLKVTNNDTTVSTSAPYTNITITWVRDAANGNAIYNVRGDWVTGTSYALSDVVKGTDNRWYKCILAHTSGASTQPITGGTYATNWAAYEGERQLGSNYYPFTVIIDADNTVGPLVSGAARTTEIYEKIQYQLRQNSDIDDGGSGSITGKTADSLLRFVGDTLVTSNGVFIESLNSNDINSVEFFDSTGTKRTFPFVAAGTLVFNANLVNDASAIYRMYFTTLPGAGNDFGESGAVLVQDAQSLDISGNVGGLPSKSWSFAYDSNTQGGRTAGTDAQVTVIAIGLTTGQYVSTTATITRTTGQNISLVSSLERNYANP